MPTVDIGVDRRGMSGALMKVAGWGATQVEALKLPGYRRLDSAVLCIEPSEASFRM